MHLKILVIVGQMPTACKFTILLAQVHGMCATVIACFYKFTTVSSLNHPSSEQFNLGVVYGTF